MKKLIISILALCVVLSSVSALENVKQQLETHTIYADPAPDWIKEKAEAFIIDLVGEEYFKDHFELINAGDWGMESEKDGSRYSISYYYHFTDAITSMKIKFNEEGNVVVYTGPDKPYQPMGIEKATKIAKEFGMLDDSFEIKLRKGDSMIGDEHDDQTYYWVIGTPLGKKVKKEGNFYIEYMTIESESGKIIYYQLNDHYYGIGTGQVMSEEEEAELQKYIDELNEGKEEEEAEFRALLEKRKEEHNKKIKETKIIEKETSQDLDEDISPKSQKDLQKKQVNIYQRITEIFDRFFNIFRSEDTTKQENISSKIPLEDTINGSEDVWVEIDPIQCLWNPWEKDWIENRENNFSVYPRNIHTLWVDQEEINIIKEYYKKQGFTIIGIKTLTFEEKFGKKVGLCEACNCLDGYTLYLLIPKEDVDKIIGLGFKIVENDTKIKKYRDKYCNVDDDCILVISGCKPCPFCKEFKITDSEVIAVNKNIYKCPPKPKDLMCIQCADSVKYDPNEDAVCINNKCEKQEVSNIISPDDEKYSTDWAKQDCFDEDFICPKGAFEGKPLSCMPVMPPYLWKFCVDPCRGWIIEKCNMSGYLS